MDLGDRNNRYEEEEITSDPFDQETSSFVGTGSQSSGSRGIRRQPSNKPPGNGYAFQSLGESSNSLNNQNATQHHRVESEGGYESFSQNLSAMASPDGSPPRNFAALPQVGSGFSEGGTPQAGLVANGVSLPSSQFLRHRKAFASRALSKDQVPEKPWLDNKARKRSDKKAYWLFVSAVGLGILGMALIVYFAGVAKVPMNKYCLVLQDDFNGDSLDTSIWFHEQETGGFGNSEFEWTTDSTNNSYVQDGNLYIVPTLTSDQFGEGAITNGFTLNLTQSGTCTASNKTDASCAVASNSTTGTILPPIQSARLVTNFSKTIKYGRVEVRARLPTGDWLWPAVWMMPKDSIYGAWPKSGEIDIVESVGNLATKRAQNLNNVFRSSLHWGPSSDQDRYLKTTKDRKLYRDFYNEEFHTFGLEWTPEGIFTWEKSPVFKVLAHKFDESFWELGDFPSATSNGTQNVNPWSGAENKNAAPFDQEFFLILNVAVGGTNGYFADDDYPDKPWSNNAENAVADFYKAKDQWLPTWPEDKTKRGMAVDYVKMWKMC